MNMVMPSAAALEFNIGGVQLSTCVAEELWLINFFFNQDKTHRPSIVGLSTQGFAPGHIQYLQLCIENRCLMFQIGTRYCDDIPSSLKEFLADEQICFVGVNMKDTLATLESKHGLKFGTNNWKDLGEWAAAVSSNGMFRSSGSSGDCDEKKKEEKPIDQLVRLAREYGGGLNLERTMYSNWAPSTIRTAEEIYYATLDAYAASLIGKKILHLDRLTPLIEWFS